MAMPLYFGKVGGVVESMWASYTENSQMVLSKHNSVFLSDDEAYNNFYIDFRFYYIIVATIYIETVWKKNSSMDRKRKTNEHSLNLPGPQVFQTIFNKWSCLPISIKIIDNIFQLTLRQVKYVMAKQDAA